MSLKPAKIRIAALLFRRVGDSLLATPTLRAIKKTYPDAHLQVIVEPQVERVFRHNPWIDEIVVANGVSALSLARHLRKPGTPDVVIDFLSDPRSALAGFLSRSPVRVGFAHSLRRCLYTRTAPRQDARHPLYSARHKLRLACAVCARAEDERTDFFLTADDHEWANQLWQERGWTDDPPAIALFVNSRRVYKRWPVRRFAEVIKYMANHPQFRPLLLLTPGDEDPVKEILSLGVVPPRSLVRVEDLGQLGAVLEKCSLLLGNDGGPKHIAVALHAPTLTIFGRDRPEFWTPPQSAIHRIVTPPNRRGIDAISVETVLECLEQFTPTPQI